MSAPQSVPLVGRLGVCPSYCPVGSHIRQRVLVDLSGDLVRAILAFREGCVSDGRCQLSTDQPPPVGMPVLNYFAYLFTGFTRIRGDALEQGRVTRLICIAQGFVPVLREGFCPLLRLRLGHLGQHRYGDVLGRARCVSRFVGSTGRRGWSGRGAGCCGLRCRPGGGPWICGRSAGTAGQHQGAGNKNGSGSGTHGKWRKEVL